MSEVSKHPITDASGIVALRILQAAGTQEAFAQGVTVIVKTLLHSCGNWEERASGFERELAACQAELKAAEARIEKQSQVIADCEKIWQEHDGLRNENEVLRQKCLSDPLLEVTFKHYVADNSRLSKRVAVLESLLRENFVTNGCKCELCDRVRAALASENTKETK